MKSKQLEYILNLVKEKKLAYKDAAELLLTLEKENITPPDSGGAIAVIGMACRFPGCSSIEEFAGILREGRDVIREIPADRWPLKGFFDPDNISPSTSYSKWGGFISGIDEFDAGFFRITPREAEVMDPQQRIFLEVAAEVFQRAGYNRQKLRNTNVGLFVGCRAGQYDVTALRENHKGIVTGNMANFIPARVSDFYNLKGPSLAVDTACSSSLVAIHLACESIRSGSCSMAVAGGIELKLQPRGYTYLSMAGALSPDGRCRVFDKSANGFVPGEGAGAILLKPYSKALADGDLITGLIAGTAVNNDGHTMGITSPDINGQKDVIQKALTNAALSSADISLIEAHGTGTTIGDPVEIRALTEIFSQATDKKGFCALSSVKSNIGHLDTAAGIAGTIKVLLAMKNKTIYPTLHCRQPNPRFNLLDSAFYINDRPLTWEGIEGRLRAGISSFGFGGTNAHIILENPPALPPVKIKKRVASPSSAGLFLLSARTPRALKQQAGKYINWLEEHPQPLLEDICYSLAFGKDHFVNRLAFVMESSAGLVQQLKDYTATTDSRDPGRIVSASHTGQVGRSKKQLVFVFPGKYRKKLTGIRELSVMLPVFKQVLAECSRILLPHTPDSLTDYINGQADHAAACARNPWLKPLINFSIDYALARFLEDLGIIPSAVIGYGTGEYPAACLAGVFSLEEGLGLLRERSILLNERPYVKGPLLNKYSRRFSGVLTKVTFKKPSLLYISPLSGGVEQELPSSYWLKHLGKPLCWQEGIQALQVQDFQIFLAVNPVKKVIKSIRKKLPPAAAVLPGGDTTGEGCRELLSLLGELYVHGLTIKEYPAIFPGKKLELPVHPFQRERYWLPRYPARKQESKGIVAGKHPLVDGCSEETGLRAVYTKKIKADDIYLKDHIVHKAPLIAGMVWIEAVYTACSRSVAYPFQFHDILFLSPLYMDADGDSRSVEICLDKVKSEFLVRSRGEGAWVTHVTGKWSKYKNEEPGGFFPLDLAEIRSRCRTIVAAPELYANFRGQTGIEHGPFFSGVKQVHCGAGEFLISLDLTGAVSRDMQDYYLHPGLLDSSLQGIHAGVIAGTLRKNIDAGFIPFFFGGLKILGAVNAACFAYVKILKSTEEIAGFHVYIVDEQGLPLCILHDASSKRVPYQDLSLHYKRKTKQSVPAAGQAVILNREGDTTIREEAPAAGVMHDLPGGGSLSRWFKEVSWTAQENPDPGAAFQPGGEWLVFTGENANQKTLLTTLRKRGFKLLTVFEGEHFEKESRAGWRINSRSAEDYQRLLEEVHSKGAALQGIIYAWAFNSYKEIIYSGLAAVYESRVLPFLFLARALAENKQPANVWLLTSFAHTIQNNERELVPAKNSLWAMARVFGNETPYLSFHSIDVNPPVPGFTGEEIVNEIALAGEAEGVASQREVLFYRNRRYVPGVVPLNPGDKNQRSLLEKSRGVFVITGGLGGIGLTLAEYLARTCGAHLVLIGRHSPDGGKQVVIEEIKKHASSLRIMRGDVTDYKQMQSVFRKVRMSLKKIDVLIHASGLTEDTLYIYKTAASFRKVIAPKVLGTAILDEITREIAPGLFVLFSGLSSVTGAVAQVDYAAANAYLDSYALWRTATGRGKTLTINWGLWKDTGLAATPQVRKNVESLKLPTIEPRDGCRAFTLALEMGGITRLLIDPGVKREDPGAVLPISAVETLSPYAFIENYLSSQAAAKSGSGIQPAAENADEEVTFLDLGLDSTDLVEMIRELEKQFSIKLYPTLFFEYQTIRQLGSYLVENFREALMIVMRKSRLVEETRLTEHIVHQPIIKMTSNEDQNKVPQKVSKDIAIIAYSLRFPGANTPEEYWDNLIGKIESVKDIPLSRWDNSRFFVPEPGTPGKTYCNRGGFVEGIDQFDPYFFNISPKEARVLDPKLRLFLEVAWETLEKSGYLEEQEQLRTGVFVGASYNYYYHSLPPGDMDNPFSSLGNGLPLLSNRLSFLLNLTGPSFQVDTYCSSALVALDLACKSLQSGECEQALVGGAHAPLTPHHYVLMSQMQALSVDGRCKTFDHDANGYVPGEGAAALLLKPLGQALKDQDRIRGVIRNSYINHGGRANNITSPNARQQSRIVIDTFRDAGLDPETVSYIEAHGTGTSLGDPVEIQGLTGAFRSFTKKKGYCAIGSVKTNIGHLEPASGMAGIIKILLSFKHRMIPPTLHFNKMNSYIDITRTPFYINDRITPWEPLHGTRRACINSFGLTGTNAHVILDEPVLGRVSGNPVMRPVYLLPLSARDKQALKALCKSYLSALEYDQGWTLADVCLTAARTRRHFSCRYAILAANREELIDRLRILANRKDDSAEGLSDEGIYYGEGTAKNQLGLLLGSDDFVPTGLSNFPGLQSIPGLPLQACDSSTPVGEHSLLSRGLSRPAALLAWQQYTVAGCFAAWGLRPAFVAGWNTDNLTARLIAEERTAGQSEEKAIPVLTPGALLEKNISVLTMGVNRNNLKKYNGARNRLIPLTIDEKGEWPALNRILALLYTCGYKIDWKKVYPELVSSYPLPTYPFQRQSFWSQAYTDDAGLEVKEQTPPLPEAASSSSVCYYKPAWTLKKAVHTTPPTAQAFCLILVFPGKLAESVQSCLEQEQLIPVTVFPGLDFRELDEWCFIINPQKEEHYLKLLGLLNKRKIRLSFVMHLLSCVPYKDALQDTETLSSSLDCGLYSLFFLTRALSRTGSPQSAPFLLAGATDALFLPGGSVHVAAEKAMLNGFIQSLGRETQGGCRFVNFVKEDMSWQEIGQALAGELKDDSPDLTILYRQTGRYVSVLKPVSPAKAPGTGEKDIPVKTGGVYLIVGGSTGIGALVAGWLVMKAGVHLVITGKTKLPDKETWGQFLKANPESPLAGRIKTLIGLMSGASTVDYISADLADLTAMQGCIQWIKDAYGKINGVIHSGGIIKDSLLVNKEFTGFVEVLRPKVLGTLVLDRVTKQEPLDFFIAFSSISAVFGNPGQTDYASANAFMDTYLPVQNMVDQSPARQGQNGIVKYLSINWPYWKEGGTQLAPAVIKQMERSGIYPLLNEEGLDAFAFCLQPSVRDNLLVIKQRTQENQQQEEVAILPEQEKSVSGQKFVTTAIRMKETQGKNKPVEKIRDFLSAQLTELLGLEKNRIHIDKKFDEFGVDSLVMKKIITALENYLRCSVDPSVLFEFATIRSLSGHLSSRIEKPGSANEEIIPPSGGALPGIEPEVVYSRAVKMASGTRAFPLIAKESKVPVPVKTVTGEPVPESLSPDNDLSGTTSSGKPEPQSNTGYEDIVVFLKTALRELLLLEEDELDTTTGFYTYGVDEHLRETIRVRLENFLDLKIPEADLFDFYPNIASLSLYLTNRLQSITTPGNPGKQEPIAVIGMACRFPGAESPEQYWSNLSHGVCSIREVPPERWDIDKYYSPVIPSLHKTYCRRGGFVDNIDRFDAALFEIPPHEARCLDPQQRHALEIAEQTFKHAGYGRSALSSITTGVFFGARWDRYYAEMEDLKEVRGYITGFLTNFIAARISNFYDLKGPSLVYDTACSSSLVSLHYACQSLRQGECRMALAGGTEFKIHPDSFIDLSVSQALSKTGTCRTFDKRADGFVPGEGVGAVLLKPLSLARQDGDRIYGLILGSAVNNDGNTMGITTPNPEAQTEVITAALKAAHISPATVSYVEAHGTATLIGDPIEVKALTKAYDIHTDRKGFCGLGSVKTNLGHLDTAAGIAGFIKVIQSLYHRQIPPTLNCKIPNTRFRFVDSPFYINTELIPWESLDGKRRAGISSFGFGGTNCHMIMEEAPAAANGQTPSAEKPALIDKSALTGKPVLFVLSARSQADKQVMRERYSHFLKEHPEYGFKDICYTSTVGRDAYPYREAHICRTRDELAGKIVKQADFSGICNPGYNPPVLFMFPGQGALYPGAGLELYKLNSVFAESLDNCNSILSLLMPESLFTYLSPGYTNIGETQISQPVTFALGYALARMWISLGVEPGIVMGHSLGEYAAACIAGVFDLDEGLHLVYHRGRLMSERCERGSMLAVFRDLNEVEELLSPLPEWGQQLAVAAINGRQNIVVSGSVSAIERAEGVLKRAGFTSQQLMVSHAFHSPLMKPMLSEFKQILAGIHFKENRIPIISNVTGKLVEGEILNADYWLDHILQPVQYAPALLRACEEGYSCFLETGPGSVLQGLAKRLVKDEEICITSTLLGNKSEYQNYLETISRLFCQGVNLHWPVHYLQEEQYRRVPLPLPPFVHGKFWSDVTVAKVPADYRAQAPPQLQDVPLVKQGPFKSFYKDNDQRYIFHMKIDKSIELVLTSHLVRGIPTLPAAVQWEMVYLAVRACTGSGRVRLFEVVHQLPLQASPAGEVEIRVCLEIKTGGIFQFEITSCRSGSETWQLHSKGKAAAEIAIPGAVQTPAQWQELLTDAVFTGKEIYRQYAATELNYGAAMQAIALVRTGKQEVLSLLIQPAQWSEHEGYWRHSPALLDGALQSSIALLPRKDGGNETLVPFFLESIEFYRDLSGTCYNHARIEGGDDELTKCDFEWIDDAGNSFVKIKGFHYKKVRPGGQEKPGLSVSSLPAGNGQAETEFDKQVQQWLYKTKWVARELTGSGHAPAFKHMIVFLYPGKPHKDIVEGLLRMGLKVTCVFPGRERAVSDEGHYHVRMDNEEDYAFLFASLQNRFAEGTGVLHLWTYTDSQPSAGPALSRFEEQFRQGFYSVFLLAQQLAGIDRQTCLGILSNCAQYMEDDPGSAETLEPAYTMLSGIPLALKYECKHVKVVHMDRPYREAMDAGQLAMIVEEMVSQNEDCIVFRHGKRWVRRLESLYPGTGTEPQNNSFTIRKEGVYLITGGLGGLGLEIARYLGETYQAKLLLLNRTPFPPREEWDALFAEPCTDPKLLQTVECINALEEVGAGVTLLTGDVSDPESMRSAFQQIRQRYPAVHGIICAAGVLDDGLLRQQSRESILRVLKPKVHGSLVLDEFLDTVNPGFVIYFSGAVTFFGNPGQCNYIAANLFMDSYARKPKPHGCPVKVINWWVWGEAGFASGERIRQLFKDKGVTPLTNREGRRLFHHILQSGETGLYVCKQFPAATEKKAPQKQAAAAAVRSRSQTSATVGRSGPAAFKSYVSRCIEKIAGCTLSSAQYNKAFLDIGVDSMALISLAGQLEKELEIVLYPTIFFEHKTVNKLAVYLAREFPRAAGRVRKFAENGTQAAPPVNKPAAAVNISAVEEHTTPPVNKIQDSSVFASPVNGVQDSSDFASPVNGVQDSSVVVSPVNGVQDLSVSASPINGVQDSSDFASPVNGVQDLSVSASPINGVQNFSVSASSVEGSLPTDPSKMKVINLLKPGSFRNLVVAEMPLPEPGEKTLRIRTRACGINFSDVMSVLGVYPNAKSEFPYVMGNEVAGIVDAVGKSVKRFKRGDQVIGLTDGFNGFADNVILTEQSVIRKPASVSFAQGAALPIVFLTAYHALHHLAGISEGETVLIMGAAGGVGLTAVQLALKAGAKVIAAAGADDKLAYLSTLGVGHVVNYRSAAIDEAVKSITAGRGVDVILTASQPETLNKVLPLLAPNGRFLEMGMAGLRNTPHVDLTHFVDNQIFYSIDLKRLKPELVASHLRVLESRLRTGKFIPIRTNIFDYRQVRDAFELIATRKSTGKVVLTFPEPVRGIALKQAVDDVAVVGMACRFPGAESLEDFWQLLAEGRDTVGFYPPDRFRLPGICGNPEKKIPGGFLKDIDSFDCGFFNISPAEAAVIDPQQRLFLMIAWEALERAGYGGKGMLPRNTGVYVGVSRMDYQLVVENTSMLRTAAHAVIGNTHSMVPGRLSYFLDLNGPAVAINTACSSSLVAIHQACRSIEHGECEMALAGGINLLITPASAEAFASMQALAADGKCKTFDRTANGFVCSEGVGVVLLKSLRKARADGDRILAVIRGSALNNDGFSNGITAPNPEAQAGVIHQALGNAGLGPEAVSYLEAHGTGTLLGDPVEFNALQSVFTNVEQKQVCALGSVKTNIGHTETAAGVAGVIKVILSLNHKTIPPTLHFNAPNRALSLVNSPFYLNGYPTPWAGDRGERLAGVSSFGFNGTNGHIVLGENEEGESGLQVQSPANKIARQSELFILSAREESTLKEFAGKMAEALTAYSDESLGDICRTAVLGKKTDHRYRMAAVVGSLAELNRTLVSLAREGTALGGSNIFAGQAKPGRLSFIFNGCAEETAVNLQFLKSKKVCNEIIETCSSLLGESGHSGFENNARIGTFLHGYALAGLYQHWGLQPDTVTGYGVGFYIAIAVSGVLSLQDVLAALAGSGLDPDIPLLPVDIPLLSAESGQFISDREGLFRELRLSGQSFGQEAGGDDSHYDLIIGSPAAGREDRVGLLQSLANLYGRGRDPDWMKVFEQSTYRKVALPPYPFRKIRCWPGLKKVNSGPRDSNITVSPARVEPLSKLDEVRSILAAVLNMDAEQIDENIHFENYGMDSMLIKQAVLAAEEYYGQSIPASMFYEYPTAGDLAGYLDRENICGPAVDIIHASGTGKRDSLMEILDSVVENRISVAEAEDCFFMSVEKERQ